MTSSSGVFVYNESFLLLDESEGSITNLQDKHRVGSVPVMPHWNAVLVA
jgi:hypothetical protein